MFLIPKDIKYLETLLKLEGKSLLDRIICCRLILNLINISLTHSHLYYVKLCRQVLYNDFYILYHAAVQCQEQVLWSPHRLGVQLGTDCQTVQAYRIKKMKCPSKDFQPWYKLSTKPIQSWNKGVYKNHPSRYICPNHQWNCEIQIRKPMNA